MFNLSKEQRNLLYVLLRMNLKRSDYGSFLGIFWSFLGPAITFLVTYLIFEERFGKQIEHFPLRLLIAIITLGYFTTVVSHTINFLRTNKDNLLNCKVPSQVFLLTSLFVPTLKFITELTLCLAISVLLGIFQWQHLPVILMLLPCYFMLAIGIGLFFCVANCFAGDIGEIWTVLSRMLIFVTPTFYTLNMLSDWAGTIIKYLNPVTPFILSMQYLFTTENVPGYHSLFTFIQAFAAGIFFFTAGFYFLKRYEKQVIERL